MLDMVLFSNHNWSDCVVENILSFFKKAKIIRILPKNKNEAEIIKWLSMFKNLSKNLSFDDDIINALDVTIDYTKNKWFLPWFKEQDHNQSYLAKHQIEWIINDSNKYYQESLKELENKQIEKSDLDAISDDVNLVKNFFR